MGPAAALSVMSRLRDLESMPWKDILGGTGSHQVETRSIGKAARDRLVEIRQDDAEHLVSLRVDGPGRVWGILDRHVFRVLWWDPGHEVYPVPKRNT
jgi:hypothetical protein